MQTAFAVLGPILFSFCLLALLHILDWLERRLIPDDGAGRELGLALRRIAR